MTTLAGLCEDLIQFANDQSLVQLQRETTRERSVLDLYFTNKPGLVKCHRTIQGISDHQMIVVDANIKPIAANKKAPRSLQIQQSQLGQNERKYHQILQR